MTPSTSNNKKSLGSLWQAQKTKQRSPALTGKITIQRHTLKTIVDQITKSGAESVTANLAGWFHPTANGHFLSIELSPSFPKKDKEFDEASLESLFFANT